MEGSGDCPQFVSMVNSAVQNLLTAKTINNEGQHCLAAYSQYFLKHFPLDLTKSLTTLKDAHVLFSASNDRIASFSAQEWDNWFRAVTKVQLSSQKIISFHCRVFLADC
jgi:hypothetical protein